MTKDLLKKDSITLHSSLLTFHSFVCYDSSMSSSHFTFRHTLRVVLALGWADFTLKYRGSVLGFLWSFIVPLVKFLVILYVFRPFVTDLPRYPLYLFLGIILWEHFAMATTACITVLREKEAIIKKILLPRVLLMLSVGWMHCIILCVYISVFLFCAVIFGSGFSPVALLYLPLLILQATLIALGIGMLLSAFSLKFRDLEHVWTVLLQILFWLTPIMYVYNPSGSLFADLQTLLRQGIWYPLWMILDVFVQWQPLSLLLSYARQALLYRETAGMPNALQSGMFTVVCLIGFCISFALFQRRSRYFVEEY